jgi:hypothetical protein
LAVVIEATRRLHQTPMTTFLDPLLAAVLLAEASRDRVERPRHGF